MSSIWILAQAAENTSAGGSDTVDEITSPPAGTQDQTTTTQQDGTAQDDTLSQPPLPIWKQPSFVFMILLLVVMWVVMFQGPKKRQKKHQQMILSLKPNDRVRTVGGILGTVISVKDHEIVLKVDESNNTKMRVVPSAIAAKLDAETND